MTFLVICHKECHSHIAVLNPVLEFQHLGAYGYCTFIRELQKPETDSRFIGKTKNRL